MGKLIRVHVGNGVDNAKAVAFEIRQRHHFITRGDPTWSLPTARDDGIATATMWLTGSAFEDVVKQHILDLKADIGNRPICMESCGDVVLNT